MQTETLKALAAVGVFPDDDANIRLYHATLKDRADSLVAARGLRPSAPTDLAERMLMPNQGYIYLASAPSIAEDLPTGEVVLAVDVAVSDLPDFPFRTFGDPPRVELELRRPLDSPLPLAFVDRLDRRVTVFDLPDFVQAAIQDFAGSPYGQQVANPDQAVDGWCEDASLRFIAALRFHGADGALWSWGARDGTWWHCTVEVEGGICVDWTAKQLDDGAPCPRIETMASAVARYGRLAGPLNPDSGLGPRFEQPPPVPQWPAAGQVRPA